MTVRCDVCGRQVHYAEVHASALGPFSFNYCTECDSENAEPLGTFLNLIKGEDEGRWFVPETCKSCKAYLPLAGTYITYEKIVAHYKTTRV